MLRLNRDLSSQSMNWTSWSNAKMLLLPAVRLRALRSDDEQGWRRSRSHNDGWRREFQVQRGYISVRTLPGVPVGP